MSESRRDGTSCSPRQAALIAQDVTKCTTKDIMNLTHWTALGLLALACVAQAQTPQHKLNFTAEPQTFPLWEHGAPGALGTADEDTPTITVYPPLDATRSGTAILIAPGGSYTMLASNHEGRQVANLFNGMGVTAFVLKYRLGPRYHHPIEVGDAQRAIRTLRAHAAEWRDRKSVV